MTLRKITQDDTQKAMGHGGRAICTFSLYLHQPTTSTAHIPVVVVFVLQFSFLSFLFLTYLYFYSIFFCALLAPHTRARLAHLDATHNKMNKAEKTKKCQDKKKKKKRKRRKKESKKGNGDRERKRKEEK